MKSLLKLARKFQFKYGQDPFADPGYVSPQTQNPNAPGYAGPAQTTDPFASNYDPEQSKIDEQQKEFDKQDEEIRNQELEERLLREEAQRKALERQKSLANKTPFTSQDAGAIVNHFLPAIKKQMPNIKGVTFNFSANGEVSASSSDPKVSSYLRRYFGPEMSLEVKQYLIVYKKYFQSQVVSFSI